MGEGEDYFSKKMSFREISLDGKVCELLPGASSVALLGPYITSVAPFIIIVVPL